jgi:hypothetical protein
MSMISKALLSLTVALVLAAFAIVGLGYGWVPALGNKYSENYFGEKPQGWVLWHASGWEDHKIFFVFTADGDWVRRAAQFGSLDEGGEMAREDCLSTFNPPWWFIMSPRTQGVCWKRREGYAGNLKIHYSPESRFVYVFDYST